MTARSNVELIVITVVVPAYARNYGELVLDRVGIFGIGAYLVLLTVEIPGSGGIQPRRRLSSDSSRNCRCDCTPTISE